MQCAGLGTPSIDVCVGTRIGLRHRNEPTFMEDGGVVRVVVVVVVVV